MTTPYRANIWPLDNSDPDRPIERAIRLPSDAQFEAYCAGERDYQKLVAMVPPPPQPVPQEQADLPQPAAVEAQPVAPEAEDYPLAMPKDCAYGWLAEQAAALGAPFAWAYISLLTLSAPRVHVETVTPEKIRPTLYSALVSNKGNN